MLRIETQGTSKRPAGDLPPLLLTCGGHPRWVPLPLLLLLAPNRNGYTFTSACTHHVQVWMLSSTAVCNWENADPRIRIQTRPGRWMLFGARCPVTLPARRAWARQRARERPAGTPNSRARPKPSRRSDPAAGMVGRGGGKRWQDPRGSAPPGCPLRRAPPRGEPAGAPR